ncbi:uncharacterized protein LOC119344670 [Triticum dicoccoides]|uniref:uncharacterized protein LOC119344670 n=1 Tax=Triticum dicoccoides TaxID=85692 RepID=UPI000E7C9E77|nr:uncharacterized protein LOC119344670 [Triticum dicoccoides]XP_037470952.1 uncharacterized protein LOC119344670 [Triticum dicoccoides]
MKKQKMANGPSHDKNKVFASLTRKDVSDIDPSYKIFLENLIEDGSVYVFHMPNGDHGLPASVRYEEDDMSYGGVNVRDGTNVPQKLPHTSRGGANVKRLDQTSGAVDVNAGHSFLPRTLSVKKNTSEVDESYAEFLSLMKIKDGFMVLELEPGVTVVYEQEEETPPGYDELRTLVMSEHGIDGPAPDNLHGQDLICTDEHGLVPCTESSDFNASEDSEEAPIALSCGAPSTFDEKLDSILSQPYDQNEYQELMRKATDQKPVSRQRQLRSGSKRYATGFIGLSYLDHYPDLAKQIDTADTDERRLNLLRKFFFWLENLCHDGAHMPWIPKALACNPIATDD